MHLYNDSNFKPLAKQRLDYFIIWGHGLDCKKEIIDFLRAEKALNIILLFEYYPGNIHKFVKKIYSHDYAPFQHLKDKTRYLLKTPSRVIIILVKNLDVCEVLVGNGMFRHIECERIVRVKNKIRDAFNPRENNKRTEHHVIHASDNEEQTHRLLLDIGCKNGINAFHHKPNSLLDLPYHVNPFHSFRIQSIPVSKIHCRLLSPESTKSDLKVDQCRLTDSPHCACLNGDPTRYKSYLDMASKVRECDNHSIENFLLLNKNLKYLETPYESSYILVKYCTESNCFLIFDGLHRAVILTHQGYKKITVAVITQGIS